MAHLLTVTYDKIADGAYVKCIDAPVDHTREIDQNRIIDFSADGSVVGIDFLEVSERIDFSGHPAEDNFFDEWVKLLFEDYQVESSDNLADYLKANSFLIGVLFEAPVRIREHFGDNISLQLQVFVDNEDEESKELFILITSNLDPGEAIRRLNTLDEDWWLEASKLTRCQLNIDVTHTGRY